MDRLKTHEIESSNLVNDLGPFGSSGKQTSAAQGARPVFDEDKAAKGLVHCVVCSRKMVRNDHQECAKKPGFECFPAILG